MQLNFDLFKDAVSKQFEIMKTMDLFETDVTKEELWKVYLNSFPEGTNPTFRERSEHDCNTCRQFVTNFGNVVAIDADGKLISVWDIVIPGPAYQEVADALSALVKSRIIDNVFLHFQANIGADVTYEKVENKTINTWSHFHVQLPDKFVENQDKINVALSEMKSCHDVLLRGLEELTMESVDDVLGLIKENSLYRGAEYLKMLEEFKELKQAYGVAEDKDTFVWSKVVKLPPNVSKIRNTAIGSLLIDLSSGVDIENAVKSFESKVAPTNYKRSSAVITPGMIEKAKEAITELGYGESLNRRFAKESDISVNDVIYKGKKSSEFNKTAFDQLLETAPDKSPDLKKIQEMGIDDFIKNILPSASKLEMYVENRFKNNFISLIAPVEPGSKNMFKWDNSFSWSYTGDVTDSIKERVKNAGGNVEGEFRCSLSWFNRDDLDLHMREPGFEIYYGSKRSKAGCLDVDMNTGLGGSDLSTNAVENIVYNKINNMVPGYYELWVHNFCKRDNSDVGFEVEVELKGEVKKYSYESPLPHKEPIKVLTVDVSKDKEVKITPCLKEDTVGRECWNIRTSKYQTVNMFMLSPNFWGNNTIGNKHYVFILDGCKNDVAARGFYNEFLNDDLTTHRKVIEQLGNKSKVEVADEQLSGLGFSSTIKNEVVFRVDGKRSYKIII